MRRLLKQPTRFSHPSILREEEQPTKHKPIGKSRHLRKVILKPNEPSAVRLQQINQTFVNLQAKSAQFLESINLDQGILNELSAQNTKIKCKCNKNVKYYCLKCITFCSPVAIPKVVLPIEVHVIHHLSEQINKSSILPMSFLTKNITFHNYQGTAISSQQQHQLNSQNLFANLPKPSNTTFVLFPHTHSATVQETPVQKIQNLIILDCTWFQTDQIINDLQSRGYHQYLRVKGYESVFWRYNHHGKEALCSAQALMYFMREYQQKKGAQVKEFDSLMLLYCLSLKMIARADLED